MKLLKIALAVQAAFCVPTGVAWAGDLRTELEYLRDTHPLIRANQYAVNASSARRHAAMSGFLPRLTITGDSGPEDIDTTPFKSNEDGTTSTTDPGDPTSTSLDRKKLSISLEQNLFNGGKTLMEVSIAGLDRSIKEAEFQATSQDVLLEAVIAYLQVVRNRLLIRLADLNEKTTLEQLAMETSRVQRGGGVVVDELQAATRLQIVRERRVFYEQGMRDAITNYEQVFGRAPELEKVQDLDTFLGIMPGDIESALDKGMLSNPRLRQIQFQIDRANKMILMEGSGFLPKVDFVLSKSRDDRVSGIYKKSEDSALFKFSWNLFSGGDSINRTRAAVSDMREIGERQISTQRKTAELVRMSWNQYQKGIERLKLLESAAETSRRVMEGRKRLRDAGRETVLAVLDSEVEYYGVLANKVNAMIDARIGSYRLLNSIGALQFDALNLNKGDFSLPVRPIDVALRQLVDQSSENTSQAPESQPAEQAVAVDVKPASTAGISSPATKPTQLEQAPMLLAIPTQPADASTDNSDQAVINLIQMVKQWASAWSGKDFTVYSQFYGDQFKTSQFRTKAAWLNYRKPRILGRKEINVSVDELEVQVQGANDAEIRFVQDYESDTLKSRSLKTLRAVLTPDGWRIVSETAKALPKLPVVKVEAPVKVEPEVQAEEPKPALEPIQAVTSTVSQETVAPVADPIPEQDPVMAVNDLVERWVSAWANKDFETYSSLYGDQFKTPQHRSKATWLKFRKPRILSRNEIAVSVQDVQIHVMKPDEADVVFVQNYESGAIKDRSLKTLRAVLTPDGWRIVSETAKALPKLPVVKVEAPVKVKPEVQVEEPKPALEPIQAETSTVSQETVAPVADPIPEQDPVMAVNDLIERWVSAWSNKDFETYSSLYGDQFKTPQHRSKVTWLKFRKPRILSRNEIAVSVQDVQIHVMKPDEADVVFVQNYGTGETKARSLKTLRVVRVADEWKIVSESVKALPKQAIDAVQSSSQVGVGKEPANAQAALSTSAPAIAGTDASVDLVITTEVNEALQAWARAWSNKDLNSYVNFYSDGFSIPKYRTKAAWLKYREPKVVGTEEAMVTVEDVVIEPVKEGKIKVVFVQRFASKALKIRSVKRMVMEKTEGGWKILSEID